MLKKGVAAALLFIVLFLSACDGKPVPAETQVARPCLEGTWELVSTETFLRAALPHGSFESDMLEYKGNNGKLAYSFLEDGRLVVQALQLEGRFRVRTGSDLYNLVIMIVGLGNGKYTVEGDLIDTGEVSEGEINFIAKMDEEEMMNTKKLDEFAPLFVPPYTKGRFVCSVDTLKLEVLNMPGIQEPIEFKRVASE